MCTCSSILTPRALSPGDTIAILSPATTVKPEYVEGARQALEAQGFRVRIMPHTSGPADGSYASSVTDRLDDFINAYSDPAVRAILCARGGYGCIHFIDKLSPDFLAADPKWVIGFSDVSALHAMMRRANVCSIHASMARHLSLFPADDPCNSALMRLLSDTEEVRYAALADERDIFGEACGELRGGNLAVLDGLVGTPFDMLTPHDGESVILFIEDVGEAIYRTERMIRRLALSGALQRYKGIIVGQFTESHADLNFATTADMLRQRLPEWGVTDIPVAFNFPIGHTDRNLPLIQGAPARLRVNAAGTILTFRSH